MLVSWRHILHQARQNLAQENRGESRGSGFHRGHDTRPWTAAGPDPMRQGRALLTRELETAAARHRGNELSLYDGNPHRAKLMQAVTTRRDVLPPAPPVRKASKWRSFAAMSSSGVILSLATYMLLHEGEASVKFGGQAAASHPFDEILDRYDATPVSSSLAFAATTQIEIPVRAPVAKPREEPAVQRPLASRGSGFAVPGEQRAGGNESKLGEFVAPASAKPMPPHREPEAKMPDRVKIAAISPQKPMPPPAIASTLSRVTEDALLERASVQLKLGDIAGARSIFETLALYGSPRGALGVAETYDPNKLAGHLIKGLQPDKRLARTWYEKAAQLGSEDASQQLKDMEFSSN